MPILTASGKISVKTASIWLATNAGGRILYAKHTGCILCSQCSDNAHRVHFMRRDRFYIRLNAGASAGI
jgi:hypothetical protein